MLPVRNGKLESGSGLAAADVWRRSKIRAGFFRPVASRSIYGCALRGLECDLDRVDRLVSRNRKRSGRIAGRREDTPRTTALDQCLAGAAGRRIVSGDPG